MNARQKLIEITERLLKLLKDDDGAGMATWWMFVFENIQELYDLTKGL
jgi:hypothetical protein